MKSSWQIHTTAASKYTPRRPRIAWLQLWSLEPNKLQGVDLYSLKNYMLIFFHPNWFGLIGAPERWQNFGFQSLFSMSEISRIYLFFFFFFFSIIGGHIPVDCLALNCTTVQPEFVSIKICNFRPHFINFSKINFYEVNLVLQCSQSHNAYVSIYGNLFYE